jgi:hypothetical protein
MGEKRNACRVLVRKHEGKDHMEDPHNKSMDDIKMYLTEQDWRVLSELIWGKVVGPVDMAIKLCLILCGNFFSR